MCFGFRQCRSTPADSCSFGRGRMASPCRSWNAPWITRCGMKCSPRSLFRSLVTNCPGISDLRRVNHPAKSDLAAGAVARVTDYADALDVAPRRLHVERLQSETAGRL